MNLDDLNKSTKNLACSHHYPVPTIGNWVRCYNCGQYQPLFGPQCTIDLLKEWYKKDAERHNGKTFAEEMKDETV